jgi:uncharacterized membrane protein YkgB
MDRYSLEELPSEEHKAEGTALGSRGVGIVIVMVGVLMIALSMLDGWIPWSL